MTRLVRPDVDRLARQLPARPLTRFAPAPTGYLHLGHVVNALYVWGLARLLGGRVLLRIEDHDRIRCRPEYDTALREDLAWLGFEPDAPLMRQSDEPVVYQETAATLAATHHVYVCDCSRRTPGAMQTLARGLDAMYTGRCRSRGLAPGAGRGLRVQLDPGVERFTDARLGVQMQEPAQQCGDLLIRDRDGNWTYQFAVTVDDTRHGVTAVIRGEDLLPSTGRQIQLARMLGRVDPPLFLHHPLLRHPTGDKLSKSTGDTGVRDLRAAGLSPAAVIGRAAAAAGLLAEPRPVRAAEVATLFG